MIESRPRHAITFSSLVLSLLLPLSAGCGHAPDALASGPVFEATVVDVGEAPGHECSLFEMCQDLDVVVTRVNGGPYHVGDNATLHVLTCTDGPMLRHEADAGRELYELDPDVLTPGTRIAVDAAPSATGHDHILTRDLRVLR
jgi:hypothetical protein